MSTKNRLKFNEDGTQVRIIFKKGEPSPWYTSMEEALPALAEAAENETRISASEFTTMREQILTATDLPHVAPDPFEQLNGTGIVAITIGSFGFGSMFGGSGPGIVFSSISVRPVRRPAKKPSEEPVSEAYFTICPHNESHGHIRDRVGWSVAIYSKEEGLLLIAKSKKHGFIDAAEEEKLKRELSESNLP